MYYFISQLYADSSKTKMNTLNQNQSNIQSINNVTIQMYTIEC